MKRLILVAVLLLQGSGAGFAAGYADWAAVIVAGDNHAHSGAPSEVFDNARRDLTTQFQRLGFAPSNMLEFSVQPEKYPTQSLRRTEPGEIANGLWDMAAGAKSGCLVYFTSHGTPSGIIIADKTMTPDTMARIVGNACGSRPTVVIIAACYSGVFMPALAASNRMVFTASRPDRPSFGCGEQDVYTFFDTCMLQVLPGTSSFPALAQQVTACVYNHERELGIPYNSEPQLSVGDQLAPALLAFR